MVDAARVSVSAMRYRALAINGVPCALAGAYLVLALNPSFIPNMTAGRGYMALAAMIFGSGNRSATHSSELLVLTRPDIEAWRCHSRRSA